MMNYLHLEIEALRYLREARKKYYSLFLRSWFLGKADRIIYYEIPSRDDTRIKRNLYMSISNKIENEIRDEFRKYDILA